MSRMKRTGIVEAGMATYIYIYIDHVVVSVVFCHALMKFKERESNSYKATAQLVKNAAGASGCFPIYKTLRMFTVSSQCLGVLFVSLKLRLFNFLSPRMVLQDSEVVIKNVAAMYGAGFHVKGNVYISVGHSVHLQPVWWCKKHELSQS